MKYVTNLLNASYTLQYIRSLCFRCSAKIRLQKRYVTSENI